MSDLAIKVDALAGRDCNDLIRQMCRLATHLGIDVESSLNGVKVRAVPYCDAEALCIAWDKELTGNGPHPFAIGRPMTLAAVGKTEVQK